MNIGIVKEIKNNESRVACVPNGVRELAGAGHKVYIEKNAGLKSGFFDADYEREGAIVCDKEQLYANSDFIYKVKEFFPQEFKYFRKDLIVMSYIHSNAYPEQTKAMMDSEVIGIAYEDVVDSEGGFPLLKPMSVLAGKGGFLMALKYMMQNEGGPGILLNSIPAQKKPVVAIIGAGNSGLAAAEMACALGNHVIVLDKSQKALEKAYALLPSNAELLSSNENNIAYASERCDVLMNCILWPKWRKDHLVSVDMLRNMKRGAMIVDVACDEGGAIESCMSTTFDVPIYSVNGVRHFCVDNIPSAFSSTASAMLCEATLPYVLKIANMGVKNALIQDSNLRRGLSFIDGKLTLEETAIKQNIAYTSPERALGME